MNYYTSMTVRERETIIKIREALREKVIESFDNKFSMIQGYNKMMKRIAPLNSSPCMKQDLKQYFENSHVFEKFQV